VAPPPKGVAAKRSKDTLGQGLGAHGGGAPLGHPSEKGSFDGCPPRPLISAEESDAFYSQIREHLSRFEDLSRTLARDDVRQAMRIGQEYEEDVRLLHDIGWGEGTGKPVDLTMPPDELRRVLIRFRDEATKQLASEEREEAEARAEAQPHREIATITIQMCGRLLAGLAAEESMP
jgi:hypothetical protein